MLFNDQRRPKCTRRRRGQRAVGAAWGTGCVHRWPRRGYTGSLKKDARDRVVVDNHPMLRLIPHPGATSTVTPPRRGATNVLTLVHHILSRNPHQCITRVGIDNVDWTRYDNAHYFAIDHPEKPLWNRWTGRIAIRFHRDERDVWARISRIYPNITRIENVRT